MPWPGRFAVRQNRLHHRTRPNGTTYEAFAQLRRWVAQRPFIYPYPQIHRYSRMISTLASARVPRSSKAAARTVGVQQRPGIAGCGKKGDWKCGVQWEQSILDEAARAP